MVLAKNKEKTRVSHQKVYTFNRNMFILIMIGNTRKYCYSDESQMNHIKHEGQEREETKKTHTL